MCWWSWVNTVMAVHARYVNFKRQKVALYFDHNAQHDMLPHCNLLPLSTSTPATDSPETTGLQQLQKPPKVQNKQGRCSNFQLNELSLFRKVSPTNS